jgi:hypothetical protein
MPRRKTSLKRNDSEKMGRELHEKGEAYRQVKGSSKNVYLATLINPVDHRLYDVVFADNLAHIVAPMDSDEYEDPSKYMYSFGQGSVDTSDTKEVESGRINYELGRSHTPSGVGAKGTGQGLMLYCGLAILAKYRSMDGIYSSASMRSASATNWWRTQVQRGFVDEDSAYVTGYTTTEVNIESILDASDYDSAIDDEGAEDVSITDVSPSHVEVEITVEGRIDFQYLTAEKVAESGYCVAWNTNDSDIEEVFSKHGVGQPKEVILGIDLSTTADPILIESLVADLREQGASDEELVLFLNRVPKRLLKMLKPSMVRELYGQLRLPLPEDDELAANASHTTHSTAWKKFFGDAVNSN